MVKVIDGLSVCVDCAMLIANGDASGMDAATERACVEGFEREAQAGGHWCLSGGEDGDDEFSWRQCDCCRSGLGGDRFAAAVIYPNDNATGGN